MQYYIGLDIGGTKCAVLLATVDQGIHFTDKLRFATEANKGLNDTLKRIHDAIDELLTRNGLETGDIKAIGISCGGPLDSRTGVILCPPNLPGWENVPLPSMLSERYGVPAFLQNDANACALVEWKLGAGEVGHLRLLEDGPMGFGKAGSFEGFTSGGGIARQAAALTQKRIEEGCPLAWVRDGHEPEEWDAKLLADYARAGEKEALAFFDHIGTMLGRGISLIVDTLNPERVVIGSIFVRCEDLLRPAMERELHKEAIPYSLNGLQIVPAQTGEALGDLASIMVALHALSIDPMKAGPERNEKVLARYARLFERYPQLDSLRGQVMETYDALKRCFENGGKLLLIGNGGSCADCDHIVGELMKGFYLKRPLPNALSEKLKAAFEDSLPGGEQLLQGALSAISLNHHTALNTAFSNDVEGVLSKNVALAVKTAKALGLVTIGLVGGTGGKLKELCDHAIVVPGTTPADVQELHLPVYHTLCAMLEEHFFPDK